MVSGTIQAYKNDELITSPVYDVIPLTLQFKANITAGVPTAILWDFGDGSTSDILEPLHTFNSMGNHRVVLTLTDDSGSTVAPFFVVVLGNLDFTADVVSGQSPLTVHFTDISIAPQGCSFTGMIWNFGDGTTGIGANPTHTYTVDNNYSVTIERYLTT